MITKKNKGGRPRMEQYEARNVQVNCKFSINEYEVLYDKAKQSGLRINDYIRNCVERSKVIQRINTEQIYYIRQLAGMANNLNQLTKRFNSDENRPKREELISLVDSIDLIIKEMKDGS